MLAVIMKMDVDNDVESFEIWKVTLSGNIENKGIIVTVKMYKTGQ